MGAIIEERPELGGILPSGSARELVARARSNTGLSDEEAMTIAVRESKRYRAGRDA